MIADTMKLLVVLLVAGIALAENPEGTSFNLNKGEIQVFILVYCLKKKPSYSSLKITFFADLSGNMHGRLAH